MQFILTVLQDIFYLPIFNVLMLLYWIVRDFGVSIILLTLLIRAAMIPLTRKQLRSQRRMMEIQPQLAALKEQYKGDQQGFARAQMQLMKENQVSMFGGCLPLVIQLPFLYGLFYALRSGLGNGKAGDPSNIAHINSQIYPFFKFANLTLPGGSHPLDTFINWFAWLPGHPALNLNAADPTHVLPILAALLTFVTVRMSMGASAARQASQATKATDSKAAAQQNMQTQTMSIMSYITPLFTLFIGWQYAAGLSLYWVISTLFGGVQQYLIYGWSGLFKGMGPLHEWANQQDRAREERREAKRRAEGSSLSNVVEGSASMVRSLLPSGSRNGNSNSIPIPKNNATNAIAPTLKKPNANGAGKQKAKESDWIEQAKTQAQPSPAKRKERPRPFVTLVTPQEQAGKTTELPADEAESANGSSQADEASVANGNKATNGAATKPASGNLSKGAALTNSAKPGIPQAKRKAPPRSGTVPKPKGGKK
ncbi:MAG TPA: membrane protein insertase YidC [Ktedonobacterales bacterium]|nr:membrane protein insertase YidC [Ktedonobacterales bacterium]